jgi:TonB family protein
MFVQVNQILGKLIEEVEPEIYDFVACEMEPQVDLKKFYSFIRYPEEARNSSVEGQVVIRLLIDKEGELRRYKIEQSDNELLNDAVISAVKSYGKFIPAVQYGKPIMCWVSIPVTFKLKDELIEAKDEIKEVVKDDTNIEIKEVINDDVKNEVKEVINDDIKNEVKEVINDDVKNEVKEVINDEKYLKNQVIPDREPQVDLKRLQRYIVYPELALKAGIDGKVVVRVLIDTVGNIRKINIEYTDNVMLNDAAIQAVKDYGLFIPAIVKGKPIICWVSIPITFRFKEIQTINPYYKNN